MDGKDEVYLSVAHLGKEKIAAKRRDVTDFARNYLGIEPYYEPVPIQPTAHYSMGGVPTNVEGQVVVDHRKTILPGLHPASEVACLSLPSAILQRTNSHDNLHVFHLPHAQHLPP